MQPMTGKERIHNILKRKPVDRVGVFEEFWQDTLTRWKREGHLPGVEDTDDFPEHFGLDMEKPWPFNFVADLDFPGEVVDETEEVILVRNGDGALLRKHKLHDSAPEHVDFRVKERADWEATIQPQLQADPRRIDFASYRRLRQRGERDGRFVMASSWNIFQVMVNVCGHEHLLAGMALDPEWVKDMVAAYSKLSIALHEILFEREGLPDGLFIMEDLGYKGNPFMSRRMFREMLQPAYADFVKFARSKDLPVLFHSCGYVEPFIPDLIDAGIDCLTALEVKAGMDLVRLYRQYGDGLSFMGGIDARVIASNDRSVIDRELEAKVPIVKEKYGLILSSDHSIPDTVDYDTYCYFLEKGLELGKYRE
jgi:uroporphyrinogen decarboxylase